MNIVVNFHVVYKTNVIEMYDVGISFSVFVFFKVL